MLLVDVDAISKLAHWDLLDEIQACTGVPWEQSATVGSLIHRCKRVIQKPGDRLFKTTEAATRALSALERMQEIPPVPSSDLTWLQDNTTIDTGEALLFSAARRTPSTLVLTGDKRALRGLSVLEDRGWEPLAGRIIILEQIILCCVQRHGAEWLKERVKTSGLSDKAIQNVLGSRFDATEASVLEGLSSYIAEIENLTSPTLLSKSHDR